MDKTNIWLNLAEEDLLWAKASFEDKILRGACFAAQQAAEKALKAFLISKNIPISKVHDLVALNEVRIKQDGEFQNLEEACNILSPYYLSTRYPDVAQFEKFSENQTSNALNQAEKVVSLVKSKI